jgi:hypothetical protein
MMPACYQICNLLDHFIVSRPNFFVDENLSYTKRKIWRVCVTLVFHMCSDAQTTS